MGNKEKERHTGTGDEREERGKEGCSHRIDKFGRSDTEAVCFATP